VVEHNHRVWHISLVPNPAPAYPVASTHLSLIGYHPGFPHRPAMRHLPFARSTPPPAHGTLKDRLREEPPRAALPPLLRRAPLRAVAAALIALGGLAAVPCASASPESEAREKTLRERLKALEDEQEKLLRVLPPAMRAQMEASMQVRTGLQGLRVLGLTGEAPEGTDEELRAWWDRYSARLLCAHAKYFPAELRTRHAAAIVTTRVSSAGKLERTELDFATGSPKADANLRRVVRIAAPFEPLPPSLRDRFDVVEVTTTLNLRGTQGQGGAGTVCGLKG
jgi:hypothetical protein